MTMPALSLRARLLVGMVALVAAGLAAAATVTYLEQRSFLLHRVDRQVRSALFPLAFEQRRRDGAPGSPGHPPGTLAAHAQLPPGTYGEVRDRAGRVLERETFTYGGHAGPPPRLPAEPPASSTRATLHLFDVSARDGTHYRAAAVSEHGDTLIAAVPITEAEQTLRRLIAVEAIAAGGLLLAMVALGWVVITIGLRPLTRIGRVASEIASGDLSRRVEPPDGRTEVGRLARSLNEMLGRIEQAFVDRQRSEERLRRFLADVSHELRTPLAAIRGYAELFRIGATTEDPEALARTLARIEAESARMGALVEELLVLARLDEERAPRREPLALRRLTEQVAQDTRAIAADRDVSVHVTEEVTVMGDREQLHRALGNLARNAVIHTPPGTPVELCVLQHEQTAVCEVRDHGGGLPAGDPEQLFERFWHNERGRRRGRGGAGLGLAIAREIARAHGGTIHAQNAPGGGAAFVLELPAAETAAASQESPSLLTSDS
ncbi:MAG: HAMP domain-containing histidine kinase [Solirubrobacterales bacterium]|nr:HAMP domain-containing histidine kinase [Solirubrobacterales bacterium]